MPAKSVDSRPTEADDVLPPVKDGELALVTGVAVLSKATRPPAPYTEASLLADMENAGKFVEDANYRKVLKRTAGLGTPATQASIIEGLKRDGLVQLEKRELWPTEKAETLISWLPEEAYSVVRTAQWETELSLIEQTGEGDAFIRKLSSEVRDLVGRLRGAPAAPPLKNAPAPVSGGGEGAPRAAGGKPTEKMVALARDMGGRAGKRIPKAIETDFEACRAFIDELMKNPPPSEKALAFADAIAKRKGVEVPKSARKTATALSAWIDANK